ncbi:MAG: IgGFc-binding protein [Polyangia bacterium]|nr:IgGFc-binding protein [Polyangia bacterium]
MTCPRMAALCLVAAGALAACGPVSPGGNQNPCGIQTPGCASESEEWACDGPQIVASPCTSYEVCIEGEGCVPKVCTLGQVECVDGFTERRCVAPGASWEERACQGGLPCNPGTGCMPPICTEGQRTCLGVDEVGICNALGTEFVSLLFCSTDDPEAICYNGQCITECDRAELTKSYLGCEYFAVDLPQYGSSITEKDYAIVVSNPSETQIANVTVETIGGIVHTMQVQPKSVGTWSVLPRPMNTPGAGLWPMAYRVLSDRPVAVYQFNSLTTIGAASTDASLLFASHTLATKYYVMDYDGFSHGDGDNFVAVYAVEGGTTVTVTPTQSLMASTVGSSISFGAASPGVPVSFTLAEFDVLVLMADLSGSSLTGTVVEATGPIGVFGGNRCTQVPNGTYYCDHLEQQIFPRTALGKSYVVSKTAPRVSCTVEDRIRVLADADNTVITVDPPVAGPFSLNAGEWAEFSLMDHAVLTADQPFYVGQFIRSSGSSECNDEGDPAFILQVPTEQYRADYVFLTPETYTTDYLAIIAPTTATVTLDGQPVTVSTTAVGTSSFVVTTLVLTPDGPHRLEASDKVGIIVYGFGGPSGADPNGVINVSYGYPGGLDLQRINPVE